MYECPKGVKNNTLPSTYCAPGTAVSFPLMISEFSCHRTEDLISIYRWENLMHGEGKYRPKAVQLAAGGRSWGSNPGTSDLKPKLRTTTIF